MNKFEQNFENLNIVNIKVDNKEQVISKFSYDENDKLNKELSEFILDKTKTMSLNTDIKLNFYASSPIEQQEIKTTLQNHFREEYIETKHELKRANIFSLIMLILGVISLSILVLAHKFFDYFYFTTILEIASWVFVWEAVDIFFLQRSRLKRQCLLMKKLYSAQVEIIINH
ncbi:MAG: hypothetical protein IJ458_03915 [Clostridia bacterium]|nr:hypothetical protein [Clostridia bacterium]